MQIVIDIPEELKNKMDNANEDNYKTYIWWFETTLYNAIKNGKSLPKGHGKLIDINEITAFRELECNGHNVESLDEFTTIIEADEG